MKESIILQNISQKLGISEINVMQKQMLEQANKKNLILLAPTGSGKTLAFAATLLKTIKPHNDSVQAVIVTPSRELAIQTSKVLQAIATGYKTTCCYGGHRFEDEKKSLSIAPDIVVGTPGRLLDHLQRGTIEFQRTSTLILDEFDKSLELGFLDEMRKILRRMPSLSRRILTSATDIEEIPPFIGLQNPQTIDFRDYNPVKERIEIHIVRSEEKDKLQCLTKLLNRLGDEKTIAFVNYRDAAERVYEHITSKGFHAGVYHGKLEQHERETAIALLNNGTFRTLICTDLGARGLDIDNVANIVHYHLPVSEEAYIHRNGRTARIDRSGKIYIIAGPDEHIPEYIKYDSELHLDDAASENTGVEIASLILSAGKKEKISRADILGFLVAKGGITAEKVGKIDIFDHYSIVAVPALESNGILQRIGKEKIKNKRVRFSLVRSPFRK